ncbi:MAG: RNA polymerase sigma factor [Myxococcota bacterium]
MKLDEADGACVREDESPAATDVPDFDTVYRDQRGRVLGAVRTILGPSDEVEDVVQLAFLEVHRCLPRFEGRSRLGTWVYRIAVNVALQHLRKKKRKRWLLLGMTGEEAGRLRARTDQASRLEDREILAEVYRAADRLSEKKRTVWVLHELEGLSPQDIGEVLDVPKNTVRSRLLAARRELMAELEQRGVRPRRRG